MSGRLIGLYSLVIGLAFAADVGAQPQYAYAGRGETSEPPLASDPNAAAIVQQAARGNRPQPPAPRITEAPTPAVALTVRAPNALPLHQDMEVRLIVQNVSRVQARNVTVVYPLPQGASFIKASPNPIGQQQSDYFWKFEKLDPGVTQDVVITIKPPEGAKELETKARASVEQEQSAKTWFEKGELKIIKSGPKQALRFDILVFGITVTNPGSLELQNVIVSDKLPPGLMHRPDDDKDRPYLQGPNKLTSMIEGQVRTWRIDKLGPKETRQIEYYVAAATAPAGSIEHGALAQAGAGVEATASDKVELLEPKLDVKIETLPRRPATQSAPARITITNLGPRMLQNIVVTDELLDKVQVDSVSGGGQHLKDRVQWIITALSPRQTQTLELAVRKADGGAARHKVSAVYRGLTQTAEANTEFDATAALTWEFKGTPATIELTGEVVYEITMRNGGSATATNVQPVIELPQELTLIKAEPENKVEGGKITFDKIDLPLGKRATFRVRAKAAQPSLGARVTAELSGDPFPTGPVRRQELTAIGGNPPASIPPAAPMQPSSMPIPVPPPPRP